MIRQLEDELREYDQLKSGELTLPQVERLDQIAPFIVKIRIAKGVSQTELARRLGVSKQVISRYEESDYQTVAIARLAGNSGRDWDQDSGYLERVSGIRQMQEMLVPTSDREFFRLPGLRQLLDDVFSGQDAGA